MMQSMKDTVANFTKVLGSASKIVLLMVTITLCVALFVGKVDAGLFEKALLLVLGYYFGKTQVTGPESV